MNMQRLPSDIVGLSKVMPPLSRRGFFMTSSAAAAAGYTLAAGPVRADAIHTDTKGLDAGMAKVNVSGTAQAGMSGGSANIGQMPVYYARPEGVKNPPIILVSMEIFGLHEYIKDVTRRLAHLGAFAIAPNYYFRMEKDGVDLTKITDLPKLFPYVNAKSDTELYSDLDATVAWAKSQGGDGNRLGIMGFCRGGRTVWHYSTHNPDLKAGVAFYGTLVDTSPAAPKSSIDLAAEVKEPVLGLYGADDAGIKLDQIAQMEEKLKAANKTFEFVVYSGAPHGFHADYRPSYRKEAAEDAWNQLTRWFKKYGVLS
jgi:carboxymethylenebutenolidase